MVLIAGWYQVEVYRVRGGLGCDSLFVLGWNGLLLLLLRLEWPVFVKAGMACCCYGWNGLFLLRLEWSVVVTAGMACFC